MKKTVSIIVALLFFHHLFAQLKSYQTERIKEIPPKIDGLFDDAIWQEGEWEVGFKQFRPNNGELASQKTAFKIRYDDDHIYIAIKAFDNEAYKIEKRMSRRDGWEGDRAIVEFDSYYDKQTSFLFAVSAAGVKNDGITTGDSGEPDDTRDPIWFVKTHIHNEGWNAEMKIPFSQVRFGNNPEQIWGIQVARFVHRTQELSTWQHVTDGASGWVSHFGELKGINNIKPKRQIQVAPYLVSKMDLYEKEEGNPFKDGRDFNLSAGVDGKIGLTNDLTLDFAINPDFGQVEADPSEVNLSAFETFFEEKRELFIEGNNITNFKITPGDSPWSRDNLFYSRRVGRQPQGYPSLEANEYVDIPENTRILGALRLTGKTKKGWSIGIMESTTNAEKAKISNLETEREETVEPLTSYFLTRIQKDINKGDTQIGGMFTSTNRDINEDNLRFLNTSATTGGLDFTQYFKERKYFVSTNLSISHIEGDKQAILNQQLSSRRLYQRPDVDYVKLDSNRTSLSGYAGTLMFGKSANNGLRYLFNFTWRSPGFETNDMGFLRRANSVFHFFWMGYSINKPFSVFRRININANEWAGWDFGGTNTFFGGNINFWMQFNNFWTFRGNISREGQSIDNTALRGGPALHSPGNINYNFGIGTNSTKKMTLNGGIWGNIIDENGGSFKGAFASVFFQPVNSFSFSINPNYNTADYEMQYVSTRAVNEEDRYIFATIEQKTLGVTLRIDYNLTPDLTLQYYGSPFISAGKYSEFKKITNPKADNYRDRFSTFTAEQINFYEDGAYYNISELGNGEINYSIDKPDFNFKQFRSNLVLRWEYKPGSLFYVVWSQGRTDFVSEGDFRYFRDIRDLFTVKPRDIFLVKFSYRLST